MLTLDERKRYFSDLGLGEYNKTSIKRFQKTAFSNAKEHDGIYGNKTDIALRHWWNVKNCTKNFRPEEFKCDCGGRFCTGYPDYMKQHELLLIQEIRDHYGRPITVTCGLRCSGRNRQLKGSIKNSKHLYGMAIDFYQKGVTDTLANRRKSLKWIKTRKFFTYGYGNGINSNGYAVRAPYMGNCMHVDTK